MLPPPTDIAAGAPRVSRGRGIRSPGPGTPTTSQRANAGGIDSASASQAAPRGESPDPSCIRLGSRAFEGHRMPRGDAAGARG